MFNSPFTATHSITSTYLGKTTIVLKFPLTSALFTNGLHKYSGFCSPPASLLKKGEEGDKEAPGDGGCDRPFPGVGERLVPRGARLRLIVARISVGFGWNSEGQYVTRRRTFFAGGEKEVVGIMDLKGQESSYVTFDG